MKCPNCGAPVTGSFCEYCGTKSNDSAKSGYQPFTYNYNYHYTNDNRQPFAANTGRYSDPQQQPPPRHYPPYNPFRQQYEPKPDSYCSEKSLLVCLLLCLTFGAFGVHRFYAGRIGTGLLYLFTFWFIGAIGMVIDLILIVCGVFKDGKGKTIKW